MNGDDDIAYTVIKTKTEFSANGRKSSEEREDESKKKEEKKNMFAAPVPFTRSLVFVVVFVDFSVFLQCPQNNFLCIFCLLNSIRTTYNILPHMFVWTLHTTNYTDVSKFMTTGMFVHFFFFISIHLSLFSFIPLKTCWNELNLEFLMCERSVTRTYCTVYWH